MAYGTSTAVMADSASSNSDSAVVSIHFASSASFQSEALAFS